MTVGAGLAVPAAPDASSNFGQPWTRSNERGTFGTIRAQANLAPGVLGWAAFGARSGHEFDALATTSTVDNAGALTMSRFDNVRNDSTAPAKSACAAS